MCRPRLSTALVAATWLAIYRPRTRGLACWQDDSDGEKYLSEALFKKCFFQLADVSTDTVDADEYGEWTQRTVDVITSVDEATGKRYWTCAAVARRSIAPTPHPRPLPRAVPCAPREKPDVRRTAHAQAGRRAP